MSNNIKPTNNTEELTHESVTPYVIMSNVDLIKDNLKKVSLVLDELIAKNEFLPGDEPSTEVFSDEIFDSNVPDRIESAFDYVVNYSDTITFMHIIKDYISKIEELTNKIENEWDTIHDE